jgi:hypothetical protein
MKKTLKTCSLAFAIAVSLTTAARADISYTWVQSSDPILVGPGTFNAAPTVNPFITSSGSLVYSGGAILGYTFTVASLPGAPVGIAGNPAFNFTDTALFPNFGNDGQILPGGNLLVSTPPGSVGSYINGSYAVQNGNWDDDAPPAYGPGNQNIFEVGGPAFLITGDWVPTSSVPEAGTVMAGALLLLPLGASALRILRRNSMA